MHSRRCSKQSRARQWTRKHAVWATFGEAVRLKDRRMCSSKMTLQLFGRSFWSLHAGTCSDTLRPDNPLHLVD